MASNCLDRLLPSKTFQVQKAKFIGYLPGYDSAWNRNVELKFFKAKPGSHEFRVSEWWLGISAGNENRIELVPFKMKAEVVPIKSSDQLQVELTGEKWDKDIGHRISILKISDCSQIIEEFEKYIKNVVVEGQDESSPLPFPDDKENLTAVSSYSSPRPANAKVCVDGKKFYGATNSGSARRPAAINYNGWQYNSPRPSPKPGVGNKSATQMLREGPVVGSHDRPIPNFRMPNSTINRSSTSENSRYPSSSSSLNGYEVLIAFEIVFF